MKSVKKNGANLVILFICTFLGTPVLASSSELHIHCNYTKEKNDPSTRPIYYSGDQQKSTLAIHPYNDLAFRNAESLHLVIDYDFLYYYKDNNKYDLEKHSDISSEKIYFDFEDKEVYIDRMTGNTEMIMTQDVSNPEKISNIQQKYTGKCIVGERKPQF